MSDNVLTRSKTFTIKDNLNPVWNYFMQVPVNEQKSVSDISVKLFDKDDFTKDDPLGDCRIPKSVMKRAADTRIRNGNRIQAWKN